MEKSFQQSFREKKKKNTCKLLRARFRIQYPLCLRIPTSRLQKATTCNRFCMREQRGSFREEGPQHLSDPQGDSDTQEEQILSD